MARVPGMDWGLYRVVTTSHAPLLCSGTLAILRPLPAHQTPAHSALSRSQTKAGAFQNYRVEYATVSLQYNHGISVIQTLHIGHVMNTLYTL